MKNVAAFVFALLLTLPVLGQSIPFGPLATPLINGGNNRNNNKQAGQNRDPWAVFAPAGGGAQNKTPDRSPVPQAAPAKKEEAAPAPREEKILGYCEGHPRKIIQRGNFDEVQRELDHFNVQANLHNGRYEICFEMSRTIRAERDQKLTIENNSNKEVVIGFLKAEKHNNSNASLPLFEIRGHNVTVFNPEISNVQKAIQMQGDGHKIVGGSITGRSFAGAQDDNSSPVCVEGSGNNIEIKNATINDCTNAIRLIGDGNKIQTVSINPHADDYRPRDETEKRMRERLIASKPTWPQGVCVDLQGSNGKIDNVIAEKCIGTSFKITGNGHQVLGSSVTGEMEQTANGQTTIFTSNCVLIDRAANVTLESNNISQCHKGIHVVDSSQIYIGPEALAQFELKKNELHHNDYAIHAERSTQVFARHNRMHENGNNIENVDAYTTGLWLQESNIFNAQVLGAPSIVEARSDSCNSTAEEICAIHYDENNQNGEIILQVPVRTGRVEIFFPSELELRQKIERYQPYTTFFNCPFENIEIMAEGFGVVRCPIEVSEDMRDKRVGIILHANDIGSSSYAHKLGILNDPGILSAAELEAPGVVGGQGGLGGGSVGGVTAEAGGEGGGEEAGMGEQAAGGDGTGGGESAPSNPGGADTTPTADPALEDDKKDQSGEGIGATLPTDVTGGAEVLTGGIDATGAPGGVGVGSGGGGKSGCSLNATSTPSVSTLLQILFGLGVLIINRRKKQ